MESDRCPPRVFDQIIEMMFPFPTLGRFDFDTRLLSVQSIDDTKYESSENSQPNAAKRECRGRAAPDDETSNRNLVWRYSRFAKKRDDCRFDWSVNVSGQVECSILRGIENDALSQGAVLFGWHRKTDRPHVPAHADDVIVFLRRVEGIDLCVVADPCEFVQKRRSG